MPCLVQFVQVDGLISELHGVGRRSSVQETVSGGGTEGIMETYHWKANLMTAIQYNRKAVQNYKQQGAYFDIPG